jgi:hypothetical protein
MLTALQILTQQKALVEARLEQAYELATVIQETSDFSYHIVDDFLEDLYKLQIAINGISGGGGGGGGPTEAQIKSAIIDASDEAKALTTEFQETALTLTNTSTPHREYTGYHYGAATIACTGVGTSITFCMEACNTDPTVEANWFNAALDGKNSTLSNDEIFGFTWTGSPFQFYRVKLVGFAGGTPSLVAIVRFGV